MTPSGTHGRQALPRSRALVSDVLDLHRQVPTCAHDRNLQLSELNALRVQHTPRIGWPVIFLKAFSVVSARHDVLRQTYRRWPWPHVFQHQQATALVAICREFQNAEWLFWGRFRNPHDVSLVDIQRQMDQFTNGDVPATFAQQLKFSALPRPIRKAIWWWNINVAGEKRAKRTGTFSTTTIGSLGAEIQHPPGFQTSNLTYGPIDEAGQCRFTIAYDHRLMDGVFIAHRLIELEAELNDGIAAELSQGISTSFDDSDDSQPTDRAA